VVVSEEILHSEVDAWKKVIVNGKRGHIIGGKIRANEEVTAKQIGCEASTKTTIEVGAIPRIRKQLSEVEGKLQEDTKRFERISLDLQTLEKLRKILFSLPPKKERKLMRLRKVHEILKMKIRSYKEMEEILKAQLARSIGGKVSAAEVVYPGVRIIIRTASMDVKKKVERASFVLDGGKVKIESFQGDK
jgi:hypothetical protein